SARVVAFQPFGLGHAVALCLHRTPFYPPQPAVARHPRRARQPTQPREAAGAEAVLHPRPGYRMAPRPGSPSRPHTSAASAPPLRPGPIMSRFRAFRTAPAAVLWLVSLGLFADQMLYEMVLAFLPQTLRGRGISEAGVGALFAAYAAAGLLAIP